MFNFDDDQSFELNKDDPFFDTKRDDWIRFIRYGWNLKYPTGEKMIDLSLEDLVDFNKIRLTARIRERFNDPGTVSPPGESDQGA